jgi:hypothetical protein
MPSTIWKTFLNSRVRNTSLKDKLLAYQFKVLESFNHNQNKKNKNIYVLSTSLKVNFLLKEIERACCC